LEDRVDKQQPSPGAWAMMGGGLVALIGSFLDFTGDVSAWGKGAFPIVTMMPLYAVVAGVLVALTLFANVKLPAEVLGFTWNQIYLVLGFFATLMGLFWAVAADDKGAGLWLILLGSIAVLVGAVLVERETATPGTLS
jgi:hypothetical protein